MQNKESKKRTNQQSRALHLYFELVATALSESGLDIKQVLPIADIPWSKILVKELLWKTIMKAQLNKRSTTEMTTKDIDAVFEVLNKFLGEKLQTHVPFPSLETLMLNQ